jgi:2-iminobutanoate/2-iminopropanoate deaminase
MSVEIITFKGSVLLGTPDVSGKVAIGLVDCQPSERSIMEHVQQPWGAPGSYSQAVRAGDVAFVAGHIGVEVGDPPVPLEQQVRTALTRLLATVELAGGSRETILKVNAYLASGEDFETYDAIYRELIGPEPMPARTTVEIGSFAAPILFEVDAVCAVAEPD